MATGTEVTDDASTPIEEAVESGRLVHVIVHADADAIAAGGLVARAAAANGTPYQLSVVRTQDVAERRVAALGDDTVAVPIGMSMDRTSLPRPLSEAAFEALATLDADPDPGLALAGIRSVDASAGETVRAAATTKGIERRPGLGVPTNVENVADGLAHSTLVYGPFSADRSTAERLRDATDGSDRALASLVAIETTADAPASAATAVERFLRPHALPEGPFATAEGLGDVLDALARRSPGLAATVATGAGAAQPALETWRARARAVHEAVDGGSPSRQSGVSVLEADADPWAVARLVRDFGTPDPAVLAIGAEAVALATSDADAAAILAECIGTTTTGHLRLATGPRPEADPDDLTAALREAMP